MFDFIQVLNKINVGIIIIDTEQKIFLCNKKIEQLSCVSAEQAVGNALSEIYPKFAEPKIQDLIISILKSNNGSLRSNILHNAFIYPKDMTDLSRISQNLRINPYIQNGIITHLLFEVDDITEHDNNQTKLMEEIENLKEGYLKVKESNEETCKLANFDVLTGLYNRRAFLQMVNTLINGTGISTHKFAVLFMDIDDFKQINDTHGHLYGDVLLQQVADRLRIISRASDIICRLGGDEFVIVLTNINERSTISMVVEKIIDNIRMPFNINNTLIDITTSIGISVYPDDSNTLDCLLQLSDAAMYRAKQNGKNSYCFNG
jgi:diguanylate cyclase (GGDEF)-like protein/PAS domain S-box-containing protein